ncbi:MAG: MBOAT family O-acyltransferase [Planctomycetota bacterium]|jgi:D-alanyl-lipoteichoic acid acyltransferase DltB (MBOAT superfamily)
MLFHTWHFFLFLLVAYPGFLLLRRTRLRNLWLLAASYFFYGWWNPLYLFLIVYSTALDYLVGVKLNNLQHSEIANNTPTIWQRSKLWVTLSVVNNLFLLGFFKYAGFVTDNLNALLAGLHLNLVIPQPNILLPIGISFYTFQSMSYTIDVYRGRFPAERNIIKFATFVAFFPQLIAGPVERAKSLLPQLQRITKIGAADVADGLSLFVVGLFKKVALADMLAIYVDKIYENPADYGSLPLIFATYAFAWQIYFDFSGYTDMARGLAAAMGIKLTLNFNNPYVATGLRDFWRRWHITLSTWFRDYVYIPLGGNRRGKSRMYLYILLTMAIGGLWHGAAWNFVLWGALHALGRILFGDLEKSAGYEKTPRIVRQLLTFHFVCLTWVFFRASSISDAGLILQRIFTGIGSPTEMPIVIFAMIAVICVYQLVFTSKAQRILQLRPVRVALMLLILIYLAIFATPGHEPFIYFQF